MIAWIDLETTGLTTDCSIIEVACVVTDDQFKEVDVWDSLVLPGSNAKWDQKAYEMHKKSGLFDEVIEEAWRTIDSVDGWVALRLSRYQGEGGLVLGGSTINFDRGFIEKWMPLTSSCLHYRNLDVSSIKQFVHFAYGIPLDDLPGKKSESKHRALDDIQASLDAVRFYRDRMHFEQDDTFGL